MPGVVVIGAGVGGLTAAAVLARAGLEVTVLEAHIYPGGCAGTFYHQGYRFDAGATLPGGFYPGGPFDRLAQAAGIASWPARTSEPSLVVHLPSGRSVVRWGDERRHAEHQAGFGSTARRFFDWQERTADAMWELALRLPPWPPQSTLQVLRLARHGLAWLADDPRQRLRPGLLADAIRPVAAHMAGAPDDLRLFVDAQLLISAQATSQSTNALYGASALDLPRRGVVHLKGGMGAIAETLVAAVRQAGGKVLYRKEVTRLVMENGRPLAVELKRGETIPADILVANLPPWNIARLLGEGAPPRLGRLTQKPPFGWGAFMLYVGLDGSALPADFPLHHQVIAREPLGEGNTIFLSLSPEWDAGRAPLGRRALTISTHTDFLPWWDLHARDPQAFEARKQLYGERLLKAASRAIPHLREASDLLLPGTPLTFERFTHRLCGWVGGFPQVDLFKNYAPRLASGLWMVGDSIFPGQSVAAVALGGLRVAEDILHSERSRK